MKTLLRYNLVGLAGVFVQLGVLNLLERQFHLHYLLATALAVETAVLHNYWWHWKWTWGARNAPPSRLLRFQFTTGLVSILGNVFGMKLLAGMLGVAAIPANLVTIASLFLFNFLVADRFVFARDSPRRMLLSGIIAPSGLSFARPVSDNEAVRTHVPDEC